MTGGWDQDVHIHQRVGDSKAKLNSQRYANLSLSLSVSLLFIYGLNAALLAASMSLLASGELFTEAGRLWGGRHWPGFNFGRGLAGSGGGAADALQQLLCSKVHLFQAKGPTAHEFCNSSKPFGYCL